MKQSDLGVAVVIEAGGQTTKLVASSIAIQDAGGGDLTGAGGEVIEGAGD